MKRRIDWSCVLLVIPVFRSTLPWLTYRIPTEFTFGITFIWILYKLTCQHEWRYSNRRMGFSFLLLILSLALYVILPYGYIFIGHGSPGPLSLMSALKSFTLDLSFMCVAYILLVSGRILELKALGILGILGICVTGAKAFMSGDVLMGSGSARTLVAAHSMDEAVYISDTLIETFEQGLGNYNYMYECAFLFAPAMFIMISARKIVYKIMAAGLLLGIFFNIRGGGLATPMVVLMIGGVLVVGYYIIGKRVKVIIPLATFVTFLLLVFVYFPGMFSFLAPPFRFAAEYIPSKPIQRRCLDIAESVENKGGTRAYASERYELQKISLNTFMKPENFFFGGGVYHRPDSRAQQIGGHSTICDTLARGGLFFGLILFFIWRTFFSAFKELSKRYLGPQALTIASFYLGSYIVACFANPMQIYSGYQYIILSFLPLCIEGCPANNLKR